MTVSTTNNLPSANALDFPIVGGNDGVLVANQTLAVYTVDSPALWPTDTSRFRWVSFNGTTATAATTGLLKLNRGGTITTVATATVAAGASVATWSGYTRPTEQTGDCYFFQAQATPDNTYGYTSLNIPRKKQ